MKKANKKDNEDYSDEIPVSRIAKKKISKPWRVEFMIIDEEKFNQNSFFKNKDKVGEWIIDPWLNKIISSKQCIEQMNKIYRSIKYGTDEIPINEHWKFAGRNFRLFNTDTKEIIPLLYTKREFYVDTK